MPGLCSEEGHLPLGCRSSRGPRGWQVRVTMLPWPQDDIVTITPEPEVAGPGPEPCWLVGWGPSVCLSVGLASPGSSVVAPCQARPASRLRQWGSVSWSPVGSWLFFYRGDSSLEAPEDEGRHLELFSFLFGPPIYFSSWKEHGHRPVPTVHLSW